MDLKDEYTQVYGQDGGEGRVCRRIDRDDKLTLQQEQPVQPAVQEQDLQEQSPAMMKIGLGGFEKRRRLFGVVVVCLED